MDNLNKFECIKAYNKDGVKIEVGQVVELDNCSYGYIYEDHAFSKEEDYDGLSHKTWFKPFEEAETVKTVLYVAVNKETGSVMSGAKGQYAFNNTATLGRSVGQQYGYVASKQGLRPKDLYYIKEITVESTPEGEAK